MSTADDGAVNASDSSAALGRGKRLKVPSVKLKDFVTNTVQKLSPSPPHSSSALLGSSAGSEPSSFKEAMQDPG